MFSRPYLARCWGLLVAVSSLAAADTPSADKDMAKLRKQFDGMDANQDGFLNVAELAKAGRGPQAQPAPKWAYDPKGNPIRSFGVAKHFYPDVIYLWSRDTDGDNRVSWEEYLQYESNFRAAVAQNPRLTRRAEELRVALQNRAGRSQTANIFSTALAGLKNKDAIVRLESAEGLALLGPGAKDAVPALRAARGDPLPRVRQMIEEALKKIDQQAVRTDKK